MQCSGAAEPSKVSQVEAARQIEEAVARAQAESDESISDLLICLGQEERKVEVLRDRLTLLGVDVDGLLEDLGPSAAEADQEELC